MIYALGIFAQEQVRLAPSSNQSFSLMCGWPFPSQRFLLLQALPCSQLCTTKGSKFTLRISPQATAAHPENMLSRFYILQICGALASTNTLLKSTKYQCRYRTQAFLPWLAWTTGPSYVPSTFKQVLASSSFLNCHFLH